MRKRAVGAAAPHLDSVTVFRPSIIVGDFHTGKTPTFHGFYTPLQLGLQLARNARPGNSDDPISQGDKPYLRQLGLRGDERKNLVPVDWVSAVMTHVLRNPAQHGETYHLTADQPVSVQEIDTAITTAVKESLARPGGATPLPGPQIEHDAQFGERMAVYRDYFRDDPQFDSSNARRVAPHLPCPRLDRDALVRLARYAIAVNFGWPRRISPAPAFDVEHELKNLNLAPSWSIIGSLGLDVSGPGGGQWQLAFDGDQPLACGVGWSADCQAVVHLHCQTLASLVRSRLTIERALTEGRLLLVAGRGARSTAERRLGVLLKRRRRSDRRLPRDHPASLLPENAR